MFETTVGPYRAGLGAVDLSSGDRSIGKTKKISFIKENGLRKNCIAMVCLEEQQIVK